MATQKLTDKTILATKPADGERVELWDEQTPGLCLRASCAKGKLRRVWVWRYRAPDGRQPRLTLADYSDKHGLKWAREEVEDLRVQVRKGADPAGKKRADKAKAKAEPLRTFDDLADAFITASERGHWRPRKKQKRERTIADERAVLRRYVRPVLGKLRLEDIDRRAIRRLLTGLVDRGIGAQANRTLAVVRQVFAYAVDQERLAANPAARIDKPATETPRGRVLTDAELKALWDICTSPPAELWVSGAEDSRRRVYVTRPMRIALQLAALLLVRRNEVAGMRLAELSLDQGVWLIPGERMKGGTPHLVPLPAKALELIQEAIELAYPDGAPADGPVFPSPRDRAASINPDRLSHAMSDLRAVVGLSNITPHDLRRTGSTAMTSERLGISPFIRSKVLGHRGDTGGGAAVSIIHYDANDYAAEKRRALEAWEGLLLLEIVGERDRSSNVRPLREAAS